MTKKYVFVVEDLLWHGIGDESIFVTQMSQILKDDENTTFSDINETSQKPICVVVVVHKSVRQLIGMFQKKDLEREDKKGWQVKDRMEGKKSISASSFLNLLWIFFVPFFFWKCALAQLMIRAAAVWTIWLLMPRKEAELPQCKGEVTWPCPASKACHAHQD